VSKESFELIFNPELAAYKTTPIPENIASYYESEDYISHSDGKSTLVDKVYQTVRKITLRRKAKLVDTWANGNQLLDIGCGTGDFLKTCSDNNWNCTGVEPNAKARIIASEKSTSKLVTELSEVKDTFDIITLWHVLEHVEDLASYTIQLKKLLKPNGTILIAVPNFNSHDAEYYNSYWAAFDVPRHIWHFSQKSFDLLFHPKKMKVVETIGLKFDAYYISLLSEKYKNGSMNYFKASKVAFKSNRLAKRTSEYSSLIYIIKNV